MLLQELLEAVLYMSGDDLATLSADILATLSADNAYVLIYFLNVACACNVGQ